MFQALYFVFVIRSRYCASWKPLTCEVTPKYVAGSLGCSYFEGILFPFASRKVSERAFLFFVVRVILVVKIPFDEVPGIIFQKDLDIYFNSALLKCL